MDKKHKYFGTDGFRGKANSDLTAIHAYKIGRFLGWYFGSTHGNKAKIVIGKDTRRSGYMLEYALISGLVSSGADAYMLHVISTPGVAYITRSKSFDCGIMITASHNEFQDNGIKLFNNMGEKISDDVIEMIESYLDDDFTKLGIAKDDLPLSTGLDIGTVFDYNDGRNNYIEYLSSLTDCSFQNLKVGLDCANGANWMIAKRVFERLGAEAHVIGCKPNGININNDCGSTRIDQLISFVKNNNLDVGFAFDGDGDRCIAVDENGEIVDGDKILYILSKRLKEHDKLSGNTIVITIMSNLALLKELQRENINYEITTVGDKFVYEAMKNYGFVLGGEASGHIILKEYTTTGDGLLTAIILTEEMLKKKSSLSMLCKELMHNPQITKNFKVKDKIAVSEDREIIDEIAKINEILKETGRIILRASGTENLIRVMSEATTQAECEKLIQHIENILQDKGYLI